MTIPEYEQQRLQSLTENAVKVYSERVSAFNDQNLAISSGRTAFFEKIAIGSGASIAAIVSFVGAKADSLEPRWMLRAALVSLAIALFSALLRNYLHPFYALLVRKLDILEAQREKDRFKAQCIKHIPLAIDFGTGNRIDADQHASKWKSHDEKIEKLIMETRRNQNRFMTTWLWSERICLISLIAAAIWLILLVWRNF